MPRQKSIKHIFVEAIVFIGVLATVGHLSLNFWERLIIQSELTQIKTSLQPLTETLTNIGNTYDNLHRELRAIFLEIIQNKHLPTQFKSIGLEAPDPNSKPKTKYTLDRRRLHDIEVKATLLDKNINCIAPKANKTTENHVCLKNKNMQAYLKHVYPGKNATTITRYPPKSIGVGDQEPVEGSANTKNMPSDKHECCRNLCPKHPFNNWKC